MPKPNLNNLEPRDIIWLEEAVSYYISYIENDKKEYRYGDGVEKLIKIRKLLSNFTEEEYNSNKWIGD
jgi:hypothetical protein